MKFAKLVFTVAGVALAWQIAFFVLAGNPQRFGAMTIPALVEKVGFGAPACCYIFSGAWAPAIWRSAASTSCSACCS
jgi:hypothetical protein